MPPDPSTSKKDHPVNRSLHRMPYQQTLAHLLAGALLSTGLGAHAQNTAALFRDSDAQAAQRFKHATRIIGIENIVNARLAAGQRGEQQNAI